MISSALQWFTILPLDLKLLEDFGPTLIKSLIYSGANPWIALKVDTNIFIPSLGAAFWIRFNFKICDFKFQVLFVHIRWLLLGWLANSEELIAASQTVDK